MLKQVVYLCLAACLLLINGTVHAQPTSAIQVSGTYRIGNSSFRHTKLLVGLTDASGLFSTDPVYIAPKTEQMLGKYTGNASGGRYNITLPDNPGARPFDITGGDDPTTDVRIFDIRVMGNLGKRDHMVPDENALASSLNIINTVESAINAGTLFVWTADDKQQFPTGFGKDKKLFTDDDPRTTLPAGWSIVNLDEKPFTITQDKRYQINLKTTTLGDPVDYRKLSCGKLLSTLIDRVERTYPFTKLHDIDWTAIRDELIPEAKKTERIVDCQRLLLELVNSIPDNHVSAYLPALLPEFAATVGITMVALTDGQIIVSAFRRGSPAIKSGLKLGATIIEWDGKPIRKALEDAVMYTDRSNVPHVLVDYQLFNLTLGTYGSEVNVTYQNPGEEEKTTTLTRRQAITTNDFSYTAYVREKKPQVRANKLPSGFGYIKIDGFDQVSTTERVDAIIDQLIKDDVPGIILDLRPNAGGLIVMSDTLASRFFDKEFIIDQLILSDGRTVYQAQIEPRLPVYNGCLAVLVELYTASAGELFAYTFKSQKRATLIGNTPTWGGGGTNSGGTYYLPGGAFMWIPTGGFYDTQGDIMIEGTGVAPDITVPLTRESLFSPEDEVLDAGVDALKGCARKS